MVEDVIYGFCTTNAEGLVSFEALERSRAEGLENVTDTPGRSPHRPVTENNLRSFRI